jgi:serine/threonine protein kinase
MTEAAAAFYYAQLLRGVLHLHAQVGAHQNVCWVVYTRTCAGGGGMLVTCCGARVVCLARPPAPRDSAALRRDKQSGAACAATHSTSMQGYCHRDIKPENCMIEAATQRLKLIDFGLSKVG